jgi:hypothetical protein
MRGLLLLKERWPAALLQLRLLAVILLQKQQQQ